MNEERFKTLFEQYLNDSIPSDELLELQEAIHDERYEALLDDLLKNAFKESAFADVNEEARQTVFSAIKSRISHQEDAGQKNKGNKRLIPYRWLSGVAALVFVALGTGWFFVRNHHSRQKENTYAHIIKPGVNKATLTLANGKKIVLTDDLHGQLASEAGVKISKTKQGEIIYTVAADGGSDERSLQYNTLTTKKSEQFQVILPDGSHVWLDAVSSLKYPLTFKGNERKVELTGQGYFEVSHNATMPFIVKTTKTEVQVLGTHFNISAYDDDQIDKTTLLEGSVRVRSNGVTALLMPGDQAISDKRGHLTVTKIDVDQEIAWKNGLFDFRRAGIEEIMIKASRWYDINVKYEGKIPETKLIGKVSRNVDISGLLEILQFEGIKLRVEGKNVIVTN
jgi:ferric-dicitrate binding protein FerR (iron transport regulator)